MPTSDVIRDAPIPFTQSGCIPNSATFVASPVFMPHTHTPSSVNPWSSHRSGCDPTRVQALSKSRLRCWN